MFGIGIGEFVVIAVLLLVVVGPQRLPTLMKAVGRATREFRRATFDLKRSVGWDELMEDDWRKPLAKDPDTESRPKPGSEAIDHDLPDGAEDSQRPVVHLNPIKNLTAVDAPAAADTAADENDGASRDA